MKFGSVQVFLTLFLVGFLVYLPILDVTFFSDDFTILNRLRQGIFSQGSFFRPLSDFSIYLDYLLWGTNAIGFHITSVLAHVLTAWLVYHLVVALIRYLNIGFKQPRNIAFCCAVIFLIYPYHAEPVVWIVGRGVILATLLTVFSYLLYLRSENSGRLLYFSVIIYFLALFGYESVLSFPIILLATEFARRDRRHKLLSIIARIIPFITVLALYLIIRWYNAGGLIGPSVYFRVSALPIDLVMNFLRLAERSIIPPLANYKVAMALAVTVYTSMVLCIYVKRRTLGSFRPLIIFFVVCYVVALLPVLTVGINTHTTEGERFLYFPSVFFSVLAGILVLVLFENFRSRSIAFSAAAVYFLYFLFSENKNWNKSSEIITGIINNHRQYSTGGHLYIINMPDNLNGAFIFRNGFLSAFQLYEKPIVTKDQLKILTWSNLDGTGHEKFKLQKVEGGLHIGARFLIAQRPGENDRVLLDKSSRTTYPISANDKVFYFDGKLLQQLSINGIGQ